MSIMKKFVGNFKPGPDTGTSSSITSQDNTLGLSHLRKLFSELKQPSPGSTQPELEKKLYNMLPLFCKVFGACPASNMMDKFPDVLQFCSHVSRLMVSEIRRRASNQSTDAASCAIVKFLEIESTEECSNGWMLLSTINLLSVTTDSVIDCMTVASLPSTLVKCLYLFFDLPDVRDADSLQPGSEFTARERRILLQKIFVQVLVRLCHHSSPAEELARKDDLTLLFSAITSWCPPHNVAWRKSAAEVLMTLSRHGLTPNVVQYIHSKGCVALCIENMQRVQELSPIELVEMFVTVFCFLKDSSDVSQMLLDDFRTCNGYLFLSEFLIKMEKNDSEESMQALRNLILLVGSLCTCGFNELKPNQKTGSLFQMPGFSIPQPSGCGLSIRNLQAFQVLQTVFLKASSSQLCTTILDVISSLYHQDNSNYFILEPQNTLSQFAEKIHLKTFEIQGKFFEIIEFIVFNLNFVPCKELISLSILIKTNHNLQCSILCMRSLMKLLQHHIMYKDIFREVGLLEVMVTCLHRYATLLKEPTNDCNSDAIPELEQIMGFLVMEALSHLLNGNNSNAGVFRECGGARCAHNMVPYKVCRNEVLNIVQQLVLCNGGDDDMGTILGLMHTAPTNALELKMHILKSLLQVLKESHRSRTVFRKVGGFVYVMSVLVSMEGSLADPPKSPWDTVNRQDIIGLVKLVFSTLTVAMRFEPANARFFATEVRYASLTEAVRLLGCFGKALDIEPLSSNLKPTELSPFTNLFLNILSESCTTDMPQSLVSATLLLRYLHDMALDNFDRPILLNNNSNGGVASPNIRRAQTMYDASSSSGAGTGTGTGGGEFDAATSSGVMPPQRRGSIGSLSLVLFPVKSEPLIVHPGAVISILHLIPALSYPQDDQLSLDIQYHMCEMIKSLVRTERNQQVMCEAGLPHELLTRATITMANELHLIHPPLQYIFERLAAQSLTPKDLRDFLRLGKPLCCAMEDEELHDARRIANLSLIGPTYAAPIDSQQPPVDLTNKTGKNGSVVALTRVKCLVSMTTPRDVRLHGAAITPSFVEFDMSSEGFGCLYLPSIAPQGPAAPSVVSTGMIGTSEQPVIGGIGSGERIFPPASGMTYSSWICIDKFSSASADVHPVRLLTIVRNIQGREENLVCLKVFLSARDRSLFVSSQETSLPVVEVEQEPVVSDTTVRFWCPELTQEGQWHHLVIIFHKAGILKNSSVSLIIDGNHISTQKLHYFSPYISTTTTTSAMPMSVFAYIATPPQLRKLSSLLWRQGPFYLIEDIMPISSIQFIYRLGPNYVGSLQAPLTDLHELVSAVVSEDRIVFGIHAHAMSLMTIAKIRKVYNKTDAKNISKQLGMSAHENATPIRILHNSAGHLSGPARSFGAILMGYLGVRTFCPKPVAKVIMNVGGTSSLLGLIAMATDVEGLYAAVKSLVCVVRSNGEAGREMDRTKGYQMLAMIFKKKRHLLNSHILHLTFSLVGTLDSGRESSIIPHRSAFESLLCDLEIWNESPCDLQRSLYEHFYELITESSEQKNNKALMLDLGLVIRLLKVLNNTNISKSTLHTVMAVLGVLLSGPSHSKSLLRFGQFMVSLIPNNCVNEKNILLDHSNEFGKRNLTSSIGNNSFDQSGSNDLFNIRLRNVCLEVFSKLVSTPPQQLQYGINLHFCEEFQNVLGFDWLMLFLQGHLHKTTIIQTTSILIRMLQHPSVLQRFRDGGGGGGWLSETDCILQNRIGVLLGFNVGTSSNNRSMNREINLDISSLPGFMVLNWLVSQHSYIPQLYFLLMSMLLGQPVKEIPHDFKFDLDSIWSYVFGAIEGRQLTKLNSKLDFCLDAAVVLLSLVRATLNMQCEETEGWIKDYPVTVMQCLLFLYHNQSEFVPLSMTSEFLSSLASTLFPFRIITSESNSEIMSPTEDFQPFPNSDQMVLISFNEKSNAASAATVASSSPHPAHKFVMDFLRRIIIDSLTLSQSNKAASVIDLALEVSPDRSTRLERKEFQTEMLSVVMDHLLAADALMGEQGALSLSTGGSYVQMANNVFYLAGRVVDKMWQGAYTRDPNEVFEFISLLISQAKRKASGLSLDGIYKSLNRTILYQLSRPINSLTDQTNILNALYKVTNNRSLILGPGNYDQEFISCLCYCLLQLTENNLQNISNPPGLRTTVWHTRASDDDETVENDLSSSKQLERLSDDGVQLLAAAAKKVWEELYVCKKPAIEEIFKVTLFPTDNNVAKKTTPDLIDIRHQIQDAAAKLWMIYYENERKCLYNQSEKIQSQLQTKLQRVGQGVIRLATRKTKKEMPVKTSYTSFQEWSSVTVNHMSIVKDLVEVQNNQFLQSQKHSMQYLMDEWLQIETELMRERGLWGPLVGSDLDKWTLDITEGPYRMRKKMMRNSMFYVHYPYKYDIDNNKEMKYKIAISFDSKKYYERYRSYSLIDGQPLLPAAAAAADGQGECKEPSHDSTDLMIEDVFGQNKSTEMDLINTPSLLKNLPKQKPNIDNEDDVVDAEVDVSGNVGSEVASTEGETEQLDNQIILRLLEEGEMITHMFRCVRIQGLDTVEGLLLFVKEHFYIIDGFTLLRTKEIADIDSLPAELHDPIIPRTSKISGTKRLCFKMAFDDMREVHKRRYLLQPIAVEIFSADGRNFLLAFPRKVRNKVFSRFLAVGTALTDSAHESVSGQRQNAKVEPGTGLISSLIGEKSVTQRWERGEISNFEYLMCLNTLAGRSYNDLMQYPVFPWILSDYDSEELDLNNETTFRNLSHPMGAQTPERLKQFKKRYIDWDDPHGETPPYHYGTHYSSAMIVASYLVRMEPFTQTFLKLQGGHFDLADRMFHSIKDGWLSASKHNMADVKELIPEFFYLPEFLLNSNNFDLGTKQSGVSLGDVVLPVWAKGDSREFIRVHRQALECDYVSSKLNEWIDLIFGFKQQCPAAVDAVNVFHHLFYEGNVDIYAIDDPLKRTATIGFINNFGQIPKQLFKKPHPQKKLSLRSLSSVPISSFISSSSDRLFFHNLDNLRPTMQPIKELKNAVGQIIHNDRTIFAVEQNKTLIPTNFNKYLAWGFPDMSIRIGNYDSDKATAVFENTDSDDILCAACPNDKTLVTAGTSTVVNVWKFGKGKDKNRLSLKQSLFGHMEAVTCLMVSSAYNVILSGSRDRTCIIWDLNQLIFVRQLRGHAAPVAAVYINELTGDIATCAGTYLHIWSINGVEIANVNTATGCNQQILCVTMSQMKEWDINNVVITGNSDGVVRMWSLEFVEVPIDTNVNNRQQAPLLSLMSTTRSMSNKDERMDVDNDDYNIESSSSPSVAILNVKVSHLSSGQGMTELGSSVESDSGENSLKGWLERDLKSKGGEIRSWHTPPPLHQHQNSSSVFKYPVATDSIADETFSLDEENIVYDSSFANAGLETIDAVTMTTADSSPLKDFCYITDKDVTEAEVGAVAAATASGGYCKRHLRDGFRWQKQLVFRSKLTMHTAFERKDNKDPAAITALSISKDHKSLFVGDAKGRVYSWSVVDQPGRGVVDHWVKDEGGDNCVGCGIKFSFAERRHHCRNCGQLFCSKCSSYETEISRLRILKPVRVCHLCYQSLKISTSPTPDATAARISSSKNNDSNV